MTLTRTLACVRSGETSTPVTVTNPMRGSRTSPVRNAPTTCRISSPTRSGRWLGRFMSEIARARVHDAGAVRAGDQPVRLAQHALGVAPVGAHHRRGELGPLPQLLVCRLGDRHVEPVVQPVLEALQHDALVLEGLARRQVQLPDDQPDDHGRRGGSGAEEPGDLLDAIGLDEVADLDVVEILDADAALEALAHFAYVFFEPLERRERAVVHLDAVADDPHAAGAGDHAALHEASRDGANLRDLEQLTDLGLPHDHFLLFGGQQAFHGRLHLFHRLIDDAVGADLHALAIGGGAGIGVGPNVEAYDDRARGFGEQHVGLGDRADAAVHYLDLHLGGRQLGEGIGQRLRRAALVGLDDDPQAGGPALRPLRHEVLEGFHAARAAVLRFALEALALLRDVARFRGVGHGEEGVARLW